MADTYRLGENSGDDYTGVTEDTFIRGGSYANNNYDEAGYLRVKHDSTSASYSRRTFLRFDLSGLPAGTITAASLFLWSLDDDDGVDMRLATCTREWVEATATWNKYDGVNAWGADHDRGVDLVSFTSPATTGVYHEFTSNDLIDYLQDVLDGIDGVPVGEANFLLYDPTGQASAPIIWYEESEGDDNHRPYLEITLGAAPGEVTRATQAGFNVLAEGQPDIRATQAGFNILGAGTAEVRATQAGFNVLGTTPRPTLWAAAISTTRIDLAMLPGVGAVSHRLYRSTTEGFTPGAGTLIGSWVGPPPATYQDTGLAVGTPYFYVLVGDAGAGVIGLTRATAETFGVGDRPILRVGSITDTTATLSVDPLSEYLEVWFQTRRAGVVIDEASLTGGNRFYRPLYFLTPVTFYVSLVKVRYAAGWSPWSEEVTWNTRELGYYDPNALGCPPGAPVVYINQDANPPTNRFGTGWFRPHPGQPIRGPNVELVFRWITNTPIWDFYLSDDLGETWTLIASNVSALPDVDNDLLYTYRTPLDSTPWPDGMDYRLKAVSKNTADDDVISLSFPIDNERAVYWWRQTYDDPGERWGKAWAQTGKLISGAHTTDGIWKHGPDGCFGAIRGHDQTALVDLDIPPSLGGDVTIRFYMWSGEGGFLTLQGRDDLEALAAGIAFFARGAGSDQAAGMWVGVSNLVTEIVACCNEYLTSHTARMSRAFAMTPGAGFYPAGIGLWDAGDIEKMWFRAMRLPKWHGLTPTQLATWPFMRWRGGPEPGDDPHLSRYTCARRWEQYALRVRAELDPADYKRVRIRARLDGMGVAEPAAGYWHADEWHEEAAIPFERGHLGMMSYQLAQQTYGQPNGARVFISWSALPLEPSGPPLIPPYTPPPWNPPQEGEPCTLVLQFFEEDRERVKWEVGTDTYHENPYLCQPEHYGEQEVDVVNGAASIGTVEVVIIDKNLTPGDQDAGWLTERLSIGSVGGVNGRRNRLLRYISPELGWIVLADGPASTPFLDETYAAFRWTIRDTRETERKVRAFVKTTTSWLLPMGVPAGFGSYTDEDGSPAWLVDPAEPLAGEYVYRDELEYPYGYVDLDGLDGGSYPPFFTADPGLAVTQPVADQFVADVEALGDPKPILWTWPDLEILWRPEGTADPWTVVQPTDLFPEGRNTPPKPIGTGPYYRTLVLLEDEAALADGTELYAAANTVLLRGYAAAGTFPNDGDRVEIAVRYTGEPTEFAPLHLEGMTTGELLKALYDGEYSEPDPLTGDVDPTGILYVENDLLEMTDPVRIRLTGPVEDLREWTEKTLYSPTGWFPALDNDALISPRSQIPPDSMEGLTNLTDLITEPKPNWDAGERIINVLRFQYPRFYPVAVDKTDAVDGVAVRDILIEYRDEASITRHGLQIAELDGQAFGAIGDSESKPIGTLAAESGHELAGLRRLYVFDRYRNGAPTMTVPVRRDYTSRLRAGDWVTVDLSWFPDYVTDRRGLITGCQILAIADLDCEWRRVLIEEAFPLIEES